MSIGAFAFRVFTVTALAGCTFTSLYLICSTGCKQNSYDFFGAGSETTTDYADDTDQETRRVHRFSQIGSKNNGFLYRSQITDHFCLCYP